MWLNWIEVGLGLGCAGLGRVGSNFGLDWIDRLFV